MPSSSLSSPESSFWSSLTQPPYSKYVSYNDDIRIEHRQILKRTRSYFIRHRHRLIKTSLFVLTFVSGFISAYVIFGWTGGCRKNPSKVLPFKTAVFESGYSVHLAERLMASIRKDNMATNLRNYTYRVHISGTQRNNKLRDILKEQLMSYDHVTVKTYTYNVLLSYHDWEQPNSVSVRDANGSILFQTGYHGPPIDNDPRAADHPELTEPYIAYSPRASVEGRLVNARYGQLSDFQRLRNDNVSCKDAIIIVMMSNSRFHDLARRAKSFGVIGLLLYPDVLELNHDVTFGQGPGHLLPGWAARRESLQLIGDPLTPGLPSREFMTRLSITAADLTLKIAVQSIGADDAEQLIRIMANDDRHDDLMNITVTEGQNNSSAKQRKNLTLRLDVFNELERRDITNIIAVIRGSEEPDRYIIVGCHYDAWTFGGVSPNTGTAVLMELAKTMSEMTTQSGWSPRRTIIFAHWDAGEMGLIGAFEWMEDREFELIDRTIAYIDLNSAVSGSTTLAVEASPSLRDLTLNAAQMTSVSNKTNNRTDNECDCKTIYDVWLYHNPSPIDHQIPRFDQVTLDSEHGPFYFYLGIPVIWPRFVDITNDGSVRYRTPVFRTSLDTFDHVAQSVDPTFDSHRTMVAMVAEMIFQLSAKPRLRMDVRELTLTLENELNDLFRRNIFPFRDLFDNLEAAVYNLSQTTAQFHNKYIELENSDSLMLRQFNDKVMRFSGSFIHRSALGSFRHLLFGPSKDDHSIIRAWPAIQDILDETTKESFSHEELNELRNRLNKEISIAIATLRSSTYILNDDVHL